MQNPKSKIEGRILQYSKPARLFLYAAVAAGFFAVVCVVAQAYLLSEVVDRVFLKKQALGDVSTLLIALLALVVVRAVAMGCSHMLAQRSAGRLKAGLREQLTRHLSILGPAYTRGERSGELVGTTVDGVEVLDEYITVYQPARLLAALVPVFLLLTILFIDPPTTLVLIFTGPILVLLLAFIGSRSKEITERRFVEMGWMSAFFLDMLQGIATLKMFGRSREQIENIRRISLHYGDTTMEILRTAFQTTFVLELGGTIATALVAVEVSLRLMMGLLPFNLALAVLIMTPEFFLPLRQLALNYHAGTAGKAAAERIFAILDMPSPLQRSQPVTENAKRKTQNAIHGAPPGDNTQYATTVPAGFDICFDNVHYAYDGGERPALQGCSFSIAQGETVALVGPTGAGKTTIAGLLMRFMDADSGVITAGGVSLYSFDVQAWRSRVSWVPQIPYLFHGTVADNIAIARPDAGWTEIEAAARAAYADEFIRALPNGYETQIGERGARLSGGQQQRLAIARAFLKGAPLLILDEATSHIDPQSEAAIGDALARLMHGRTVLVIAHSLKLAAAADRVVVLEAGRVIEAGAPSVLLASGGSYQELATVYGGGAP